MTTDPSISVRKATIDDLDALADLFCQYRAFYGRSRDLLPARAFLADRLERQESVVFIASMAHDGAAGFAQLYPTFSSISMRPAWILNDLFVTADRRRRGVAEALLSHAIAHGRATGAAWITLQTAFDNVPAQTLYRDRGFEQDIQFLTFNRPL